MAVSASEGRTEKVVVIASEGDHHVEMDIFSLSEIETNLANTITNEEQSRPVIEKKTEINTVLSSHSDYALSESTSRRSGDNSVVNSQEKAGLASISVTEIKRPQSDHTKLQLVPTETRKEQEKQAHQDRKEQKKAEVIVVTKTRFNAKSSSQMSFCKGASIREVDATGKWHKGVLKSCCGSENHRITGKLLFYPSNFVCKVSLKDQSDHSGQVVEARPSATTVELSSEKMLPARQLGGSVQAKKADFDQDAERVVVVAMRAFEATKRSQLSFCGGDLIQEIDASRKWHKGILLKCENGTHAITGQQLYYPSNFVKRLT